MSLDDPHEFEKVFKANHGFVLYLARQFGAPPQDCEEIVQEAFYRLHKASSRVDTAKVKGFLVVTVRNLLIDRLRKTARIKVEPLRGSVAEETSSFWESNAQRELEAAIAGDIIDEIAKMPGGKVFALYYRDGLTIARIAELSGDPPGTVASRIARFRQCFKNMIQERINQARG